MRSGSNLRPRWSQKTQLILLKWQDCPFLFKEFAVISSLTQNTPTALATSFGTLKASFLGMLFISAVVLTDSYLFCRSLYKHHAYQMIQKPLQVVSFNAYGHWYIVPHFYTKPGTYFWGQYGPLWSSNMNCPWMKGFVPLWLWALTLCYWILPLPIWGCW